MYNLKITIITGVTEIKYIYIHVTHSRMINAHLHALVLFKHMLCMHIQILGKITIYIYVNFLNKSMKYIFQTYTSYFYKYITYSFLFFMAVGTFIRLNGLCINLCSYNLLQKVSGRI